MVALRDLTAISYGSACTSSSYTRSHMLSAMRLDQATIDGAIRISWCHLTEDVDWSEVGPRVRAMT